jgi:hypothetical protein
MMNESIETQPPNLADWIIHTNARIEAIEQAITLLQGALQHEARKQLAPIAEEAIRRVTEAVESEWTGKFLPELRRTIRADVQETLHSPPSSPDGS